MNKDVIQGRWNELKGTVKSHWAKLTDDDLALISGKKDELLGLIQEKYGHKREQVERELKAFVDKYCQ